MSVLSTRTHSTSCGLTAQSMRFGSSKPTRYTIEYTRTSQHALRPTPVDAGHIHPDIKAEQRLQFGTEFLNKELSKGRVPHCSTSITVETGKRLLTDAEGPWHLAPAASRAETPAQ